MSIIVKGIELPEKVQVLELHPDGKVFTRKGYLVGEAVELPDKHGRLVDADALEKEGWSLHRTIRVDKNTSEYQTKPIRQVPTIEPRCEACEAFNKTRLLIPQPQRKKGKWIEHNPHKWGLGIVFECSECGEKIDCEPSNFCPNCGADMTEGEG